MANNSHHKVTSLSNWQLLASTRPAIPRWRLPPSWWNPLWGLLLAVPMAYLSLVAVLTPFLMGAILYELGIIFEVAIWLVAAPLLAVVTLFWRKWKAREKAKQQDQHDINDEAWDTMLQALGRLGGYLPSTAPVRGFWTPAMPYAMRHTWSLQAKLHQGGHVEIDYLLENGKRHLRIAAQEAPGETLREIETILTPEDGEDLPAMLGDQVGRFLLSVQPEALKNQLKKTGDWSLQLAQATLPDHNLDPLQVPLAALRPPINRLDPWYRRLFLGASWHSYTAMFVLFLPVPILTLIFSLSKMNDKTVSWSGYFFGMIMAVTFLHLIWRLFRPNKPATPARRVREREVTLTLDQHHLHIVGQDTLNLENPITMQLSRHPDFSGEEGILLQVELLQRNPDGGRPKRVRLSSLIQDSEAAARLPALQSDAPLVDTEVFSKTLWPRLRYWAALHNADPGLIMTQEHTTPDEKPSQASEEVKKEEVVSEVVLSRR